MTVTARIKGLPELKKQLKQFGQQQVPDRTKAWMATWGKRISDDMKGRLKRGGHGRYTGRWAAAMGFRVFDGSKGMVGVKIGANATGEHLKAMSYGPYVEGYPEIPRRHFLPFAGHEDFADWARRIAGIRASQIDMTRRSFQRKLKFPKRHSAPRKTRTIRAPKTDWREAKRIKGLMVGGPKSIRPAVIPAIRKGVPMMKKDVKRILAK